MLMLANISHLASSAGGYKEVTDNNNRHCTAVMLTGGVCGLESWTSYQESSLCDWQALLVTLQPYKGTLTLGLWCLRRHPLSRPFLNTPPTVVDAYSGSFWMGASRNHPSSIKRHQRVVASVEEKKILTWTHQERQTVHRSSSEALQEAE